MRKLAMLALASVGTLGVTVASGESASALTPCRDSNGSAPGGSVYLGYYSSWTCNVTPPQRLHLTGTPSNQACLDSGGHGWTSAYRICWDVDY